MKLKVYASPAERWLDIAIGFGGWFVINGLLWLALGPITSALLDSLQGSAVASLGTLFFMLCAPPLLNVVGLIGLLITRRWMVLGALAAFGFNLAMTSVLRMFASGMCSVLAWPTQTTIPFFLYFLFPALFSGLFGLVMFQASRQRFQGTFH